MIPAFAEFERYTPDMDLVLSCSGGKDSVAIGIALNALGIPFRAVFADTGWEHAETYRYLREVVPELIGREVVEVRLEIPLSEDLEVVARLFETRLGWYSPMVRAILQRAMFPSRTIRWCTQETKLYPLGRFLDVLPGDPVVVTGIRRAESARRSTFDAWEAQIVDVKPSGQPRLRQEQTHWRPALHWSYDDVIGVFQHVGVAPNPLYLAGTQRVGCWPCINASRADLRLLAQDMDRAALMRDLEAVVGSLAAERSARLGNGPPTFFQARTPDTTGKYPCWPIDRVLTWARGKPHNPNQAELFWAPQDGCARWGLCPSTGAPKLWGAA